MTVPAPTPSRSHGVLFVLVLAVFAYNGLETTLAPAVPLIQKAVGASTPAIAWVFTGVLLAGAVATPTIARLADIRDKRRVLLWVLAIVCVGTIVAALAKSVLVLTIGQLLQGTGLGLIPLSMGLLRDTQPPSLMKAGNGLIIGVAALSTAVGLLVAGPIVARMPYTWLFWFPLALLVVTFVAAWFVVPSCPPAESGRLDWRGAALLGLGLVVLLVAITKSSSWGWTSGRFLGLVATALVILALFAVVELRTEKPLVDLHLMASRSVVLLCVISFVVGFGSFTIFALVPMLVQMPVGTGYGLGGSATVAGLALVPMGVVGTLVAPLTGRLESRAGTRAVMVLGTALLALANVALLAASQAWVIFVSTALAGAGIGLTLTHVMNIVVASVPGERTASVSGMTFVIKAVGGAVGAQVGLGLLAAGGAEVPAWSNFRSAFLVGSAVVVVAALLSFAFPTRTGTTAQNDVAPAQ
ncbi:MFS transporter [Embleya sp. NBC_00888]|uniref:MFS transporter n=1 Tax=Embleya sp. NBC_00888 TaxID=2975960 RepID=UPI0038651A8E|nr:MFS transporter [Embleya sp. NBC_00888]